MNDYDLLHPPPREPDITVRRFLLIVAAAVLFCFAALAVAMYTFTRPPDCPQCERRTFDSEIWKRAPMEKPYPRVQMVDDLLQNYKVVGMTPEMVEGLLGPASTVYHSPAQCEYFTLLGAERSIFAIDGAFLCLNFEDGHVIEARIVEG
jgi:hypothetical protein